MSARAGAGSLVRVLAMLGISAAATAAGTPIELDPGTTFSLYSTDSNDGYEFGRGMLFAANETLQVNGAWLYTQSTAGLDATIELFEVFTSTGSLLTGAVLLYSGGAALSGPLGFHGTQFPQVTLDAGSMYLLRVDYAEPAEENWYFDFDPTVFGDPPVDIGPLTLIDGTQAGHTANFVAPLLQLQASDVRFFTNPNAFQNAATGAGKTLDAAWNFTPHDLMDKDVALLDAPLNITTHHDNPDDPWGELWPPQVDSVGFSSNTNPGGSHMPGGPDSLLFVTPGFLPGIDVNALLTSHVNSFDMLIGQPGAAIGFTLAGGVGPGLFRIAVYDTGDQLQDELIVTGPQSASYVGILLVGGWSIGRVEIWAQGGGFEGISSFELFADACPWDCGDGDGSVGILDFLALLAQWDEVASSCDFDGDGVGITDFLDLLANWGPCP